MYKIISGLSPQVSNNTDNAMNKLETLSWDNKKYGTGILFSENNTQVFLKEQAYVFRSVVANIGFTCGVNYWEIIADART